MSLDRDELHVIREEKQAMLDDWSKKVSEYEETITRANDRIKVLTKAMDGSLALRTEARDLRDMVTMQRDVITELHGRIAKLEVIRSAAVVLLGEYAPQKEE